MLVKQISVFLENKEGRIAEVARTLSDKSINIRALSIADTTEFGILRLIVDKPDLAEETLKKQKFTVNSNSVIAISIDDRPGGLADALEALHGHKISIEYLYAFISKSDEKAMVILRVEDTEDTVETLISNGFPLLDSQQVYGI